MNWEEHLNLLNDIFREGPVVIFVWRNEPDWPVEFVSENVEEIIGFSFDDWIKHKIRYSDIIYKEDLIRVSSEVKTYSYELKLKRWKHKPYRIVHKNGDILWIDDYTYCIYDENHLPLKYIGYIIDITQQYKLQKELEEEFRKYYNLFEHHSAPMLIIEPNTGQIVQVNDAATKFYGYSKSQFKQLTIYDINALSNHEIQIRMQEAKEFKKNYFQFPHRLSDNTIKEVEVYSSIIEIKNKQYLFSIIHDITEKVKLQKELETLNLKLEELLEKNIIGRVNIFKKFYALLNQNLFGVGVVLNNKLIEYNACLLRLLNLTQEQIHEIDFFELFIFGEEVELSKFLKDPIKIRFYPTMEVQLKSDLEKYFIMILNPFMDIHSKNDVEFLVILFDITHKKRLEKEKREQERFLFHHTKLLAIYENLSIISHHWRQPLNSINLMLQYILELIDMNQLSYDILKQTLNDAMKQIQLLSKTISDFYDFYSIDTEQRDFNVQEELNKVVDIIKVELENFNIKIFIEGENFCVYGNSSLFKNAILNLINNAKDSIFNVSKTKNNYKGIIKISLDKNKKRILICDNGEGIRQEIMDKLFQPYITTKSMEGRGLGLYLTKIIFNKMNAIVRFWNKTNESGACFEISFKD